MINQNGPDGRFFGQGIALVGAHGGAGLSTVAALLDPKETGRVIELTPGMQLPLHYAPVVVARTTGYGLRRTGELLASWHPQVPRPWLVLVADAPMAAPKTVAYRRRALGSRVLGVAEVPYLYRLRDADTPTEALSDRHVAKAGRALRARFGLND